MKVFIYILLLLFTTINVLGWTCPPDYCTNVTCKRIKECPPDSTLKHGGTCNCCNVCFKILGENETCSTLLGQIGLGVPQQPVECGENLVCIEGICQNTSVLKSLIKE